MHEFIKMGEIGRPHGVRGELRVNWYGDSLDALSGSVLLQAGNQPPRTVTVSRARLHQGLAVVTMEGVDDRNAAEALRGQSVLVRAAALPPTDDDIYLHEILGLSVVLHSTGAQIGVLDHVHFHGEQEVWVILTPDGKEVYLPAVPEFVPDIDLDAEVIRVDPPEGLLELYLE